MSHTSSEPGESGVLDEGGKTPGADSQRWESEIEGGAVKFLAFRSSATEVKNWSERLESLETSVFGKLAEGDNTGTNAVGGESGDKHRTVKWSLVAHLDAETDASDKDRPSPHYDITAKEVAASNEFSGADKLTWFSIPKSSLVPWKKAALLEKPQPLHFAIEMAYDLDLDLDVLPSVKEAVDKDLLNVDKAMPTIGYELPERIILNSLRLRRFLHHEFCDERLPFGDKGPFHILRPYKMLSYLDHRIRQRIAEFRRAREAMWTASEDEYVALYQANPVEDEGEPGPQRESQMTLEQLTAYIMDFKCLERILDIFSYTI